MPAEKALAVQEAAPQCGTHDAEERTEPLGWARPGIVQQDALARVGTSNFVSTLATLTEQQASCSGQLTAFQTAGCSHLALYAEGTCAAG